MPKKLLFNASLKHWDTFDIALFKLSLMAFALFVVCAWPGFSSWVASTSPVWFLIAFIAAAIRPYSRLWKK
jgi:hypothetical protein